MATKKQSPSDLQASIGAQLIEVNEIVKLCGFAAEARRILSDIDVTQELDPELAAALADQVAGCYEWAGHDDNLGAVLKIVSRKIQAVFDQVERAEVHHAVRS